MALGATLRSVGKGLGALFGGKPDAQEAAFIETLFLLFGHLARADGFVSHQEAELGERLITDLALTRSGRKLAVESFERGKQGGFDLDEVFRRFNAVHAPRTERSRQLLDVLFELANADGKLRPAERGLLERIGEGLGFSATEVRKRLEPQKPAPKGPDVRELAAAYQALGTHAEASDDEVRQAYRRKLSKMHPDKLSGQGVRGDALKGAQAKTVDLRGAYELICQVRGMR
jgi:DnaJ like chaperone protein